MKKLTALLLTCTAFICAAVSCGDKKDDTSSSAKKTETTTTAEATTEAATEAEDETTTEAEKKDEDKTEADDSKSDEKSDDEKKDNGSALTDTEVAADVIAELEAESKKFSEVTVKPDMDAVLGYLYPKALVDALKEAGYSDAMGEEEEGGTLNECKIDNVKELNAEALAGAEKYFSYFAEMLDVEGLSVKAEKGYFYDLTTDIEKGSEQSKETEPLCLVYLKDEGWKVVPVEAGDLLNMEDPMAAME